jgi:hypothetical protein
MTMLNPSIIAVTVILKPILEQCFKDLGLEIKKNNATYCSFHGKQKWYIFVDEGEKYQKKEENNLTIICKPTRMNFFKKEITSLW